MTEIFLEADVSGALRRITSANSTIRRAFADAAKEQGQEVKRLFEGTVSTWNNKPQFDIDVDTTAGGFVMNVKTDDPVYKFIDKGTTVRRALMSRDWKSKTKVDSLKSGGGRGRVVFISKKISRPGIRARNFTKNILEIAKRTAPDIAQKHLGRWVKRV